MRAHHLKLVYLCLALILVLSFASISFADPVIKGQWYRINSATSPPARHGHAMVFYPPSGENPIIMFGGIGSDGKARNDMWSFENGNWRKVLQNVKPSARAYHQMALDREHVNLVLFGGDDYSDNKTWIQKYWGWISRTTSDPTDDKPSARSHHAMAYDPVKKIFTMCGGLGNVGGNWTYLKDVWQWSGSSNTYWKRLGKTLRRPRFRHGMAFDYVNKKLILFGGVPTPGPPHDSPMKILEDVNGEVSWKDLRPITMPPATLCNFAMASDSHFKKVVIFGGYDDTNNDKKLDETWAWDGKNWAKVETHGQSPSPRQDSAMVYDFVNRQFVLFGGKTDQGISDETWIFSLAATRYVDPANLSARDQSDCSDKTMPCKTINYALSRALIHDEIRLAASDYTVANQDAAGAKQVVHINKTANISGGWNSDFTQITGKSRIIGASTARCIKTDGEIIVYLANLDLSKGQQEAGGGLYSAGGEKGAHIKLTNVTANGNKATAGGGIFVSANGKLELDKCQVAANQAEQGGGVYINKGELTLIDSKVELNIAQAPTGTDFGGGIAIDSGKLVLIRSSINKNHADHGGGIYAFNLDAGGRTDGLPPPQVQMQSSTVALNKAAEKGAGIYAKTGKFMINSSTIAGNETNETAGAGGGGIFNDKGEIKMSNTILAANKSLKGGDCLGKIDTLGFNLIGDTGQCQAAWKQGDIHAAAGKLLDPKLEPFAASWGGYPLKIDSPAKGKANPAPAESGPAAVPKYDQRNVEREKHWPPDIGAYEDDKSKPQMPETGLMEIIIYIGMGLIIALMVFRLIKRKKD